MIAPRLRFSALIATFFLAAACQSSDSTSPVSDTATLTRAKSVAGIDSITGSPVSGSAVRSASAVSGEGFQAVAASAVAASSSLVLTFEELTDAPHNYHSMSIHNPYHGVTFSQNLYHYDEVTYGQAHSGVIRLFNAGGVGNQFVTVPTPTNFLGVWASEPHGDGSQLIITGYNGNTLVGTVTSPVLTGTAIYVAANFSGPVTKVVFNTPRTLSPSGYFFFGDWYVIDDIEFGPAAPVDNTAPSIQSTVTGTLGSNDWYTSDVSVSWTVTDAESDVTSPACASSSVTADTEGTTFSCTATSAGGTATKSVTVKRDATNPTIGYTGNAGTYSIDQTVAINCAYGDATSGVATQTCANVNAAAASFSLGAHTYSASVTDNAGNSNNASTTFTVVATPASLAVMTTAFVTGSGAAGVVNSLVGKLEKGNYTAFINEVRAQSGKSISTANAALLTVWAQSL